MSMIKVTIEFEAQYGREASAFFANLASAMGPTVTANAETPATSQVTETVKPPVPETTKRSKKAEATKETAKEVKPSEAEAETTKENSALDAEEKATDKEPAVTYTLVQVREKLAELSRKGKQAQVKALIEKHGATKLSEIKEESYAALMKEAEGL